MQKSQSTEGSASQIPIKILVPCVVTHAFLVTGNKTFKACNSNLSTFILFKITAMIQPHLLANFFWRILVKFEQV